MAVLNEYTAYMIEYIDVMLDNADVYYYWYRNYIRDVPAGGKARADKDIDNIEQTAIKCTNFIEKHKKPK